MQNTSQRRTPVFTGFGGALQSLAGLAMFATGLIIAGACYLSYCAISKVAKA